MDMALRGLRVKPDASAVDALAGSPFFTGNIAECVVGYCQRSARVTWKGACPPMGGPAQACIDHQVALLDGDAHTTAKGLMQTHVTSTAVAAHRIKLCASNSTMRPRPRRSNARGRLHWAVWPVGTQGRQPTTWLQREDTR